MLHSPADSASPPIGGNLRVQILALSAAVGAVLLTLSSTSSAAQSEVQATAPATPTLNIPINKPISSPITLPLALDLFNSGKSSLTFNSAYHFDPSASEDKQTPLLASLDWVGNTRFLANSILTSGLHLDLRGGDWLDRSAVDVADKSKLKYADISVQLSRAGTHFLQGTASGLTPGKEIAEFLTTLHPSSAISLSTTLRETTVLPDPTAATVAPPTTTRVEGAVLALTLPMNTKIQAGSTQTSVTTPGTSSVNTTTDSVRIDSDLPDKTQVAGMFDSLVTTSTSATGISANGSDTQKSSIQVTSKAIDQVTITGSVKSNQSSAGANDTGALSMEATPFARDKKKKQLAKLKVTAAVQSNLTNSGVSNSSSAQIYIPNLPIALTSLTGGITHTSNPTSTETIGLLDADAKPLKSLELTGGARLRDGYLNDNSPDPNAVNTYKMKFLFGPSKLLKLTGTLAANPEASDGTVSHSAAQTLGLDSDLNLFKITGSIGSDQEYSTSKLTNNLIFGIDLRLTPHDILTTGWEGHSTLDTALSETSIYRLAYTHKVGSTIDVSLTGSMTETAVNGIASASGNVLKAEAKVGLHF